MALGFLTASASAFTQGVMWTGNIGQTETEMEAVQASGAEVMRVPLLPELTPNGNSILHYDTIFQRAAEHEVRILPIIQRSSGELPTSPTTVVPSGEQSWQQWIEEAVGRYGYNGSFWSENPGLVARPVTTWELDNEPNLKTGPTYMGPTNYGKFVAWAGPVIQATSKAKAGVNTEVLFGGLFLWGNQNSYKESLGYLASAWSVAGVSSAVTGVSIHPYELDPSSFYTSGASAIEAFSYAIEHFRSGLSTYKGLDALTSGAGKTIWITEAGWPAAGAEWLVTPAAQASLLTQSFEYAKGKAASLMLQGMIWYNFRDAGGAGWAGYCGLLTAGGEKRASWTAFKEQTHAVAGPDVKVAFRDYGNANTLSGWQYNPTTGWQQIPFWGHQVAPNTKPVILRYNESSHVFFADASRENRLTEWAWNKTTGWQQHPLESDPVAAGSSPTGVVFNGNPQLFFADAATNREVTSLTSNGATWTQTRFFGDPVAENSSPSAVVAGSGVRVFFADSALERTLSSWEVTSTSVTQAHFYGDVIAAGSSPSAVQTPGSTQVFFADSSLGGTLSVWVWAPTAIYQQHFYGDVIAKNSSPSAIVTPGSTQIYFADESQSRTISVWVWTPTSLVEQHFYQDAVAVNSSPTAVPNGEKPQVYFSDEATNGSVGLWEWGSTLTQTRLFGHLVAPGSSPAA